MKTKSRKQAEEIKPRVNVITLGCSKNIHDSEVLMGQLRGNSMDVVHEDEKLNKNDIIVINTCGF
ncbi:MAG: 30S ribosomal protein S12 methylthiotransferase RimO, partial [Pedobacter sp.]